MRGDTDIGGRESRFPQTRMSAVLGAGSDDQDVRKRSLETLVGCYWKPVYKYVRLKWQTNSEEAKDLTQGFFARSIEKATFEKYDAGRGSFRTYLRTCLDGFVANERKSQKRLKRGGDVKIGSLDFNGAETEFRRQEPPDPNDADKYFHHEWVRSLFAAAVTALQAQCRESGRVTHFIVFARYDLEADEPSGGLSYEQLAKQCGLTVSQVTNQLAWSRREFRRLALEQLRAITATDEEFTAEAASLFGGSAL